MLPASGICSIGSPTAPSTGSRLVPFKSGAAVYENVRALAAGSVAEENTAFLSSGELRP